MNIQEACDLILGPELAESITKDMGLHWAAVAATADFNGGAGAPTAGLR